MKVVLTVAGIFFCGLLYAQSTRIILVGHVYNAADGTPLAYATVAILGKESGTITAADGRFELTAPAAYATDTLVVSYIGFTTFQKAIPALASDERILLKESVTMLDEVTVVYKPLDLRETDKGLRIVKDKLYAMEKEVTNQEYHQFLAWLENYNKHSERRQYGFDLSKYGQSERNFYEVYHRPVADLKKNRNDPQNGFAHFPVVHISHEAATAYCDWLTEQYNSNPRKKKFRKVRFRLPTLAEWQIAALGYDKFQSWNLLDNTVEVIVTKDSLSLDMLKGDSKRVQVDESFWFPWYYAWHYRNNPQNSRHCFLGNFKVESAIPCPKQAHAFDGFSMMAPVGSYFPNNIGLYDVAGNVAEMISEKGKACGGSWNDLPENSTIQSVKTYRGPDETVGFRVFMEVVEE